ncbi:hypothetical protein H0H92_004074 [Tricholoma furcatifolium]|nr:hypothetical protein H0H92_004074 [Tricholoma furcatifolium]
MPADKAQVEKWDYIPLPATEPQQPQDRRRKFLRLSAYVLLAFLGLKTVVHTFAPSWPPHFPRPPHAPFPPKHRLTSAQRDELFLSIPNAESAIAASRAYATHPHRAGSSEDFEDAKVILELFQTELGISPPETEPIFSAGTSESRNATLHLTSHHAAKPSAWVDVYYPVLNTPLDRSLQILGEDGSVAWEADLVEDGDPLDEDAAKYRDAVPAWHGLSKDGEVEGQLVYANYGTKTDYDELVAAGADLKGKIIITRYGRNFRGLKIKAAQELGAAGVLIYSDPRDDGYVTVENGFAPYPAGPARNPTSVQRGSVQFLSSYPGDPTTPGYPSYEDAERTEGTNIPKIPSLPISWANGARLLEEIGDVYVEGKDGKKTLSGKASASKVKLVNHVDTKVSPIWNAMAAIPGHIKDEVVIVGGHRDAWVLGAADPTSGTVSLHEIIRGLGALLKKGWRPLRTIVIASWDAEEYGLIGSTEWGEDFAEWISEHAVAYLNVDTSSSGSRYNTAGSPSLANLIKQVALEIPHPTIEGKTLWDARNDDGPFQPASDFTIDSEYLESYNAAKRDLHASKTGVAALGSGSDFTVFLQRLGVASSQEGFGPTSTDAVYHYHSIYDSQRFQEIYADPGFHRHVAVAKHLGLLTLRLADSFALPMNITQYAFELDEYLDKIYSLQSNSDASLDLSKLSKAIKKVQGSSVALEKEMNDAVDDFKRILRKIHRHFPHRRPGHCRKSSATMRRVKDWIKGVFGVKPHNYERISDTKDREIDINAWAWHLAFEEEDVHAIPPPPPFAPWLVDGEHGHDRKHGRPKHHPEDGPEHHKPGRGKHRHEDPDHPKHRPDRPEHGPEHPRPDHPKHRPDRPEHGPDHPRPDHPKHPRPDHPKHDPEHPRPDHPKHPRPDHPKHDPEHPRPDHPKHPRPDHPKHDPEHPRPDHPKHPRPDHPKHDPEHPRPDHPKHPRPDHPKHDPDHPKHPRPDHPEHGPDHPKHPHPDHPEGGPDHHKHRRPKDGEEHRKPGHGKHRHSKDYSADSENHDLGHPFPPKRWPGRPPKEIKKLVKAAKRIVKANKKIIAFERGFISEDGIKDREWYKHLGVAPGKWLGYGATTFPALAEALEFDKNVTLAEYEARRLTDLLEKLAHSLKP